MKKVLLIAGGVLGVIVVGLVIAVFVLASGFEAKISAPNTPYLEVEASKDPEVIARGEYLVRTVGHCTQCHGAYPRENPALNTADVTLSGAFEFSMGPIGTIYSANLTSDSETGIGKYSDKELARLLATGIRPNGQLSIFMRYGGARPAQEDIVAMVSYLRSLPPTKKAVPPSDVTTLGKAMLSLIPVSPNLDPLPKYVPAAEEPSVERGGYLAENVTMCVMCHSKIDMSSFQPTGPKAGGGDPDPSPNPAEDMEYVSPNLTSHPTGMTGKLTEDAFVARLRTGRSYAASKMPWENLSRMSESDLRSIYRYLRSLPPVEHDVGPTQRKPGWKPPTPT